jgi:2-oxoglutarate dehydrogenase E2 component (dihydrolipoamide succinyltransferase)
MSVIEMKVPVIGESVTEVTLSQWLKEDGEYVEMDEPICEFESDKATLEFPAEAAGKLTYVAAEGDDLEIGALVAKIDTSVAADASGKASPDASGGDAERTAPETTPPAAEPQPAVQPAPPPSPEAKPAVTSYATGTPSPAAGKILREKGIPAEAVAGTGRDGRITKADAQDAVAPRQSEAPAAKAPARPQPTAPTPQANFSREVRREKMSRMRRTIADRLVSAKNETAMLTTFNEVDLSAIMALRKQVQERFVEKFGVKLGFMSLFAKACAKVLMDMPAVNAMIDDKELVYHDYADISFAISTPTGLVVPPIHNVESLHFAEIELKLKELAAKARNGKLSIEEMQGGTFTITNGGVFGSLLSTPIINKPQSAILGMHGIKNRPVAIDGKVEIRPMMYLALSYDHRVIDGSSSVTFLVKLIELLEDPNLLFLDL